jgi:signal-transduction protein with cAMP-binding, CBS, and nucleotidyltransferase domain
MKFSLPQTRTTKRARPQSADRLVAASSRRSPGARKKTKEVVAMQREAKFRRMEQVQAHPVAELLECPPAVGLLLNRSAQCLSFEAGEIVFRQSGICRGLYLVITGQFQRQAERQEMRLTLAPARAGDLVELAAALGDRHHTFTLAAQTAGSVLMLPIEALNQSFQNYPPLRMQLLEELAREVSRAYNTCSFNRVARPRRVSTAA